jgi:hypothetical protein
LQPLAEFKDAYAGVPMPRQAYARAISSGMAPNRNAVLPRDDYVARIIAASDCDLRFRNSGQNGDGQLRPEEFVSPAGK